jgi:glycosyltransferase involved in cell wall biosynthesis
MRILFLPQTCDLDSSSRYRVHQLLPYFEKQKWPIEVSPAIDATLYPDMYVRAPGPGAKLRALQAFRRQRKIDVERVWEFDLIYLQKGIFPGLDSSWELKMAENRPIIVDLDSAVWLPRDGEELRLPFYHREESFQKLLQQAKSVVAGNEFIANHVRPFNPRVTVIPTSIDTARYRRASTAPVVGWIGSRTALPDLKPLASVFQQLNLTPRVIAGGDPGSLGFKVDFREWSLATEVDELAQIGIGIAPLPETPWANSLCGVKLLQYMACGMPVVASPVGVHREIIQHGVNGLLAATPDEWRDCLKQLIGDESLRQRLGAAGRETVASRYDIQNAAEQVAAVLEAAAYRPGITTRMDRLPQK